MRGAIFPLPLFGSKPGTKNDVAMPSRPARPVRPMRCTYESKSSAEVGRSKFTTCATPGTSFFVNEKGQFFVTRVSNRSIAL